MEFEPELTLESAIMQAIDARAGMIWTSLPCQVTAVDGDRVSVAFTTTDRYGAALPDVVGVRVIQPLAGNVGLSLPVASGTEGLLLVCATDPSAWLQHGSSGPVSSTAVHQLGYGLFLPGVGPSAPSLPSVPTLGSMSHTAHNMALGDNIASVLQFLHTQISTVVPSPTETGLASLKAAWTGQYPVGLPNLDTSDAKVTK